MVLIINACSPARGPTETPRPVPSEREPEPLLPAEPLPMVSNFRYAPGAFQYEVRTQSLIRQSSDSSDTVATVATTALISIQLDSLGEDSLRVQVTLDSVAAERDSLVPPPDSLAVGATFAAYIDAQGMPLDSAATSNQECTLGDQRELLTVARDLLIEVPHELRVGAKWSDTSSVAICRAGVPLTSGVVRNYEVMEPVRGDDGTALARISLATTFSMAGTQTTSYGQVIALSGSGESRSVLELDPAAGVVRSALREGTSSVTVTYGRSTQLFTQQMTQRVRSISASERE